MMRLAHDFGRFCFMLRQEAMWEREGGTGLGKGP